MNHRPQNPMMTAPSPHPPVRRSFFRRLAPAMVLFVLAPICGEYLLGNLKFSEMLYVPFIAPLYGGGALLIRECTRRAGRGYPTMLILGIAYACIEEGLVDQMFFNPLYFPGQEQLMTTVIPLLGIDAWLTIIVIAMHAVWSTCIPIILVEAIFAAHGTTPWLRLPGFVGVAVLFIGGAVWLGQNVAQANGFVASAPQLLGTAIVIVTLSSAAFTLRDRARAPVRQGVPNPWMTGGLAFITSSLFMLTEVLPGWTRVGACIFIAAAGFIVIFRWAQRSTWNALHTLSLAGGALLTYASLGALMEPETGSKTSILARWS